MDYSPSGARADPEFPSGGVGPDHKAMSVRRTERLPSEREHGGPNPNWMEVLVLHMYRSSHYGLFRSVIGRVRARFWMWYVSIRTQKAQKCLKEGSDLLIPPLPRSVVDFRPARIRKV